MQVHGTGRVHSAQPISGPHTQKSANPAQRPGAAQPADRLDISDAAQFASQVDEVPEIRADLVQRVRNEIAEGRYETDAKLDVALERVLDDLG